MRHDVMNYYCFELGFPAPESMLRRAATAYGVSLDYLLNSATLNHADSAAYLLAHLLADFQETLHVKERAAYLRRMRVSAGFSTLEEAVSHWGFHPLQARAHELGVRLPTAAELAGYALAYDWHPVDVLTHDEDVDEAPYWERHYPEEFIVGRWGVRNVRARA
jgi:hypothetical protein